MPGDKQQGQSAATIDKERRIGAALSVGMRIASAKFGGHGFTYWHFDANAGSGWNENVNVPGSPLVFWDVAKLCLSGMEAAAFFCDLDLPAIRRLQVRLNGCPDAHRRSFLLPGDNQEALEVFAECIRKRERRPHYAVGSLLVDPNGYYYRNPKGIGAPIESLQWFCREFPRIDIVLNLNIRTYQMQKAHSHNVLPARDVLSELNKSCWLISRAQISRGRYLLAIGRNTPTSDHTALQLYKSDSEMGQFILNWAEGKQQGDLKDVS